MPFQNYKSGLLLSLLATLLTGSSLFGQYSAHFEVIDTDDGLSQGYVALIHQDKEGFLWLGTRNGLNRYDGREFKNFTHDPMVPFSIAGNMVVALIEWGDYLILGLGAEGLGLFHKKTQQCYRLNLQGEAGELIKNGTLSNLNIDQNENLWFEIRNDNDRKVGRLNLAKLLKKDSPLGNIGALESPDTYLFGWKGLKGFCLDANGEYLWAIIKQKLCLLNLEGILLKEFELKKKGLTFLSPNLPLGISPNPAGGIWLTGNSFIGKCDGQTLQLALSNFKSTTILQDEQHGGYWVLTDEQLLHYTTLDFEKGRISSSEASVIISGQTGSFKKIYPGNSGILWIATSGHGFIKYIPRLQRFQTLYRGESVQSSMLVNEKGQYLGAQVGRKIDPLPYQAFDLKGVNFRRTNKLLVDKAENHWLLSNYRGKPSLFCLPKNKTKWEQSFISATAYSSDNALALDKKGDAWVAIPQSLLRYTAESRTLDSFSYASVLPENHRVNALALTIGGVWWIGTSDGLVQAVPSGNGFNFNLLSVSPGNKNGIQGNIISILLPDPKDSSVLWVGTIGGGLSRLDSKTLQFSHYNIGNGFPDNVIYGILPDDKGGFWISSNKGIIWLNPQSGAIKQFTIADGLPSNEFNTRACGKGADGTMYFGCVEGLVYFNPQNFSNNQVTPVVRLIGLALNEHKIAYGDSTGILQEAIEYVEKIELPFSKNSFTLEFAALEYSIPAKNRFRYYLKGAEPEWTHESSERTATYLNLAPGSYTFFVKACNNDGKWHETATTLQIIIHPPWYRSNLAYFIYVLLSVALLFMAFRFFLQRLRLKYELAMGQLEATRLKDLNNFKSRLYTNITHEFRTPLTIIQGMAMEVQQFDIQKPISSLRRAGGLIHRNGKELLSLINQLLDLAKLEDNLLHLNPAADDLVKLLKYLIGSFESLGASRDIDFRTDIEPETLMMEMDGERIQTIMSNLFSNALKFTPTNGAVDIQLQIVDTWNAQLDNRHFLSVTPSDSFKGQWASITVKNTGPGIPSAQLPFVFDRFYQAQQQENISAIGTGVGLALVKELVLLMDGALAVRSQEGVETAFVVILPIVPTSPLAPTMTPSRWDNQQASTVSDSESFSLQELGNETLPSLLIVEDNQDVQQYIITCVKGLFQISLAHNGEEGIEMALENVPDIILSDVMMPKKDGFELVKTLKSDERCSHIPIVLLTARADLESRIKGLERGADAYLAKPFEKTELLVWLRKLLESRRNLQERYSGAKMPAGKQSKASPDVQIEDAFIHKIQSVLKDNMQDEDFGVQQLCQGMHMGRTQLHNKLKALTGQSTTLYIRSMRLQRARHLLLNTKKTVSEIAFEVGFKHLQHFSTSFAEEFGQPPSSLRK